MKNIFNKIIAVALLGIIAACTGPEGPEGPPGRQGPRGPQGYPGEEGLVIEYSDVDFREEDNFGLFLPFDGYEAELSDAVLVYALWDVVETEEGPLDIWRQLPQTTFIEEGSLVYNFNHSTIDVELFLDASFDLYTASLGPGELDDWVIRIVIVPAQFLNGARVKEIDYSNYEAVEEAFGLPDLPVPAQVKAYERPAVEE